MNVYVILVAMLVMCCCCMASETGPLINALRIDKAKLHTASTVHGRQKRTGGLVGNILKFVGDTIGDVGSRIPQPDWSRPYKHYVYMPPTVPSPTYPIYGPGYNQGWRPINSPGYGHGYGHGYGYGYGPGYGPGYPRYGPGYQGYGPGHPSYGPGNGQGTGQGFGHGYGPSNNPGNAPGYHHGRSIAPTVSRGKRATV